jgi:hypothetical protein
MKPENNHPIKVLMFYDLKGWAWWHRVNNIARHQPEDIITDSLPVFADFNHQLYDFIVIFDSFHTNIIFKVPGEKLIIGCSCPIKIKEFVNALLVFKPLAGLVNNREMYNYARDFYKIFYCPNGVDEVLFKPGTDKIKNLTASWVGNSGHFVDKGLANIRSVCKKVKIPLITCDRSDNQNGILLTHNELRDKIYHKTNFYICFSDYEGTPNPALEALSCGLPVITTKVGNMPEIIEDGVNGFFSDRNEKSLFNTLQKLKKSDIGKMSVNARDSILNGWSWKNQAKKYTNMFWTLKSNYPESDVKNPIINLRTSDFRLINYKKDQGMPKVKLNKQSLLDVTFLFPVRLDTIERLENILASTNFLLSNFETNIRVSEYSSYNNGLLGKLLDNRVGYTFQEDNDPILFRTKFINQMTLSVETPFVAVWDTDVITPADQIIMALNLLRNREADFVYPYEKYALDTSHILRKMFLIESKIELLEQNMKKMKEMYPPNPLGGAFLVNLDAYKEAGLENEDFYGWGLEDGERFYRWEALGYKIKRVPGPLFHLSHGRGLNSSFHDADQHFLKRKEVLCVMRNRNPMQDHFVNK